MKIHFTRLFLGILLFLAGWIRPISLQAEGLLMADRIAAIINSEPILLSEIQEKLPPEQKKDPATLLNTLNQLIDQKLQIQTAGKRGLTVSENEIHQALQETRVRNGLTDEAAFKKSLEKENLTLEQVTEEFKKQILIRKLFQKEVLPDVVIKDEELSRYYHNHPELFKVPEKRKISQILFKFPAGADSADIDQTKQTANTFFVKIQEGKSIEQIIEEDRELSRNFTLSELGSFKKGELLPALDQVAFSLETGKWSKPVETGAGILLLKVDQNPSDLKPYEEVLPEIKERLFQERSEAAMDGWMSNLRKNATIDIPLLKDKSFKNQGILR
ncbi:MAG: peptidylprolyl isomerase [Nitrospiria bacterium]